MKERPIIFNAEMVRAVLDGRKSQTRRVIKPQPTFIEMSGRWMWKVPKSKQRHNCDTVYTGSREWHEYAPDGCCPYGVSGDRLWVRETWRVASDWDDTPPCDLPGLCMIPGYDATYAAEADPLLSGRWRRSLHMPRWASRITLEVVDIRVERVQDISEDDAHAEGININSLDMYMAWRDGFRILWKSSNDKRGFGWAVNPWVWVVEFKVINAEEVDNARKKETAGNC